MKWWCLESNQCVYKVKVLTNQKKKKKRIGIEEKLKSHEKGFDRLEDDKSYLPLESLEALPKKVFTAFSMSCLVFWPLFLGVVSVSISLYQEKEKCLGRC